jgi:hypothetical protein
LEQPGTKNMGEREQGYRESKVQVADLWILDELEYGPEKLVDQLSTFREPFAEKAVRVHLHQLLPTPTTSQQPQLASGVPEKLGKDSILNAALATDLAEAKPVREADRELMRQRLAQRGLARPRRSCRCSVVSRKQGLDIRCAPLAFRANIVCKNTEKQFNYSRINCTKRG